MRKEYNEIRSEEIIDKQYYAKKGNAYSGDLTEYTEFNELVKLLIKANSYSVNNLYTNKDGIEEYAYKKDNTYNVFIGNKLCGEFNYINKYGYIIKVKLNCLVNGNACVKYKAYFEWEDINTHYKETHEIVKKPEDWWYNPIMWDFKQEVCQYLLHIKALINKQIKLKQKIEGVAYDNKNSKIS